MTVATVDTIILPAEPIRAEPKNTDMKTTIPISELRLLAVSGDCAAGGLGKSADVLEFKGKHIELIKNFIRSQTEFQLTSATESWDSKRSISAFSALQSLGLKMKKAGVFKHKWHLRTEWALRLEGEV